MLETISTPTINEVKKYVYVFGNHMAEGNATMKNLLGGKGANLAEMSRIGIPVPPGFTLTTEVSAIYNQHGEEYILDMVREQVRRGVRWMERAMGQKFGDPNNPLLLSVRSGARVSMPGMMDTVLNLGLNDTTVQYLAKKTGNDWFAYDSYRRFLQMFGNVTLGVDSECFEEKITEMKETVGVETDQELSVENLQTLIQQYKDIVTTCQKTCI